MTEGILGIIASILGIVLLYLKKKDPMKSKWDAVEKFRADVGAGHNEDVVVDLDAAVRKRKLRNKS